MCVAYLEGVLRKLVRDHACREMELRSSSLNINEENKSKYFDCIFHYKKNPIYVCMRGYIKSVDIFNI